MILYRGSICLNSGDRRDIGGSNRNLLDFNDLHIDREGRVYVAFLQMVVQVIVLRILTQAPPIHEMDEAQFTILQAVLSLYVENGEMQPLY